MKTSSKIIIAVLTVAAVALLIVILIISSSRRAQIEFDKIETTILEKGDLKKIVFADGQVRSESYTRIYPTVSGVVKEINVSAGDEVSKDVQLMKIETGAGIREIKATINGKITNIWTNLENQVNPGNTPLIEIVDYNNLMIEGLVLENDVAKIAIDQTVRLDFPALEKAETDFLGTVTFVAESPLNLDTANPNYRIKVRPDSLPEGVKFGMTANMEIIVDELKDVLHVDNVYLYSKDDGQYLIKVLNRSTRKTEEVEVEIGFEGENNSEIISGVKGGDEIMLPTVETNSFGIFGNNP